VFKQTPAARITKIKEFVQSSFVMPKPKISKSLSTLLLPVPAPDKPGMQISITPPEDYASNLASLASKSDGTSGVLPYSECSLAETGFFGSTVDARKVCFLVDCSGSMHGMFRQVADKLKSTITALQPDQYFYIILFGRDEFIENGGGRLIRATGRAKQKACDFLDSAVPGGRTNALAALRRAMEIRDSRGSGPAVIFFLTDGFELLPEDEQTLLRKVAAVRKSLSPGTRINTIGFWAQPADCAILKEIARESGGEFSHIGL
jgi:hypothetical protein